MAYKVIARKWRPQSFADMIGQRHVTQTLENAIRHNRLAHAYIFCGTRGVGKTTTARILAKCLNCEKGPASTPCNECAACVGIAAGGTLDVLEIDAASNRGIDQIRELRDMVRYAPAAGRYKVVILDEAHQLTDDASNALLKTLEEPPEKVVFILATTKPEDLADTIKSRAQLFQFRSLSFQEIADALSDIAAKENLEIEPGALAVLARAAEGSLRDGLSLLEQAIAYSGEKITDAQVRELLGVVAEEVLDELMEAIANQSAEQALALAGKLHAEGMNLQHFCREAIRHVRNLLVAKVSGAESPLISAPKDERPRLARQAEQFSEEDLTRFFQILVSTDDDLRRKSDTRLHLELGLLRLVNASKLTPLEEVLSELRGDSAGRPNSSAASARSSFFSSAPPNTQARFAGQDVDKSDARPQTNTFRAAAAASGIEPANFSAEAGPANNLGTKAAPVSVAPPRPVADMAERQFSGLAAAQMDAIQSTLREQQKFLWSMVEHASRWELAGAELSVYFPPENSALADMLQARDAMEKLRTVLAGVMGQPLRVCVKLDSSRSTPMRAPEIRARFEQDPVVRAMIERFGGRISEVKRRSED